MSLPKFEYIAPNTIVKATSVQEDGGKFLAGGTDLFVAMKERISSPTILVDLNKISQLKKIKLDKSNTLGIGAMSTLMQIKESPIVQDRLRILSQIIPLVSTPQLQNMGTLGGNLCLDTRCCYYNQPVFLKKRWGPCLKMGGKTCHVVKGGDTCYAVYSGDMATPLIALGAKVKVAGPNDTDTDMELQSFFSGSGVKPNILKFNEILTEVLIPTVPEYSTLSYQKLRLRDTMDFPLLGVAVFLNLEGREGRCRNVRIVMGAVAPSPIIVKEASELICGRDVTSKLIEEVSKIAQMKAHPVDNTASSPRYRREMVQVLVKKAFDEAIDRIKNGQT